MQRVTPQLLKVQVLEQTGAALHRSRYLQESGLSDNSPISDAAEEPHKKQRQRTQFTDNL